MELLHFDVEVELLVQLGFLVEIDSISELGFFLRILYWEITIFSGWMWLWLLLLFSVNTWKTSIYWYKSRILGVLNGFGVVGLDSSLGNLGSWKECMDCMGIDMDFMDLNIYHYMFFFGDQFFPFSFARIRW